MNRFCKWACLSTLHHWTYTIRKKENFNKIDGDGGPDGSKVQMEFKFWINRGVKES
jgi:hypothetical protein